jgi:transglutaminase-like putative cysteine protease
MKADGTEVRNLLISQTSNQTIQTPTEAASTPTKKPPTTPAVKSVVKNARMDEYESYYQVNPDYTYTEVDTQRMTLLTPKGIEDWQRATWTYTPDTQSLEVVEAYVIQPNGEKVKVTKENIFTRPSQESQNAPGFSNSMTTTVVFPKLMAGSQTFVKWKLTQKKPSVVGFSGVDSPLFEEPTVKDSVKISLPASLRLRWEKRGDYVVSDQIQGDRRIITAVIANQPGRQYEDYMVDTRDVNSIFVFSNLDSWEEMGKILWRHWHELAVVTPEIKELADKITGDKQGIEAARLIYNWVAQNIEYLAVFLNESAGYVPHKPTEILRNGYGDCKDHVLLMQTLLKAKGIDSVPVSIDWGDMFQTLPLPTAYQFNHMIIYLPDYNIFADPTDNYGSFGELDYSRSNKFVVMATEKGRTAYTPKSVAEQNRYLMNSTITIAPDGTINGQSELQYFGNLNSLDRRYFASYTPEQIVNQHLASTPEGGTGTLKTSDLNNLDQPLTVKGKWSSPYAVSMDKQIYFSVPVGVNTYHPQWMRKYITFGKRLYPIIFGADNLTWEYKIILPNGYKISRLPENRDFANAAGEYKSSYEAGNGYIRVKRNWMTKNDVYSAEEYPALKDLVYKAINDARSVMVLEKR